MSWTQLIRDLKRGHTILPCLAKVDNGGGTHQVVMPRRYGGIVIDIPH